MKKIIITFTICLSCILTNAQQYEIKEINDIQYYDIDSMQSEKTMLNLVIPQGVDNPPVLIWVGQGAWAYVDRNVEMNICREIAKTGILVVSAGHRLSPALLYEPYVLDGVQHPEHVKDVAQAFKWVCEHSVEYNYDSENIFIGGYSSGAHLSALLAMDMRYLNAIDFSNTMIKGLILVGGGYDIPEYRDLLMEEDTNYLRTHIKPVFGDTEKDLIDASPVTYIDFLITPILLISERETYQYSKSFEELLYISGFQDFEVLNVYNQTHSSLWYNLGGKENSIYRNYIVDYIKLRSK